MAKWIFNTNDANITLMAQTLKISPILCEILANRGVRTKNSAIKFLNPLPGYMHDGSTMAGMTEACAVVLDGIRGGKKFCIYGDYDVDGITATTILHKGLTGLGANCGYYIPHREHEGYGLNIQAVEKIAAEGLADILITVDNGIAAMPEVSRAKELGIITIILDHHEPPYTIENGIKTEHVPNADVIIDPKQATCEYPFKGLCAASIAYKFAEQLYANAKKEYIHRREAIIFAAIASFCDVVDLVDENRIIAASGLALLNNTEQISTNIGLNALVKARNLEYNNIGAFEIGFIIGPCINAAGRLDSAKIAVDLFLTEDVEEAARLAARLAELNDERKALCAKFVEKSITELQDVPKLDKVLVIYEPDIHESIAGIVAGRIKDAIGRPAIVLSQSSEGGVAKGSARSIDAYDIFFEMQNNKELFLRFGGHKMAAGVTLPKENIDTLRRRLNETCALTDEDFVPILYIDKELELEGITFDLAQSLEKLAPFGKANKQPIFATRQVFAQNAEIIGQSGNTLRLTFRTDSGRPIRAVAFNSVQKFSEKLAVSYSDAVVQGFLSGRMRNLTVKMDVAYHIEINTFNGNSSLQLRVLDFEF